jgi:hypothetical protein
MMVKRTNQSVSLKNVSETGFERLKGREAVVAKAMSWFRHPSMENLAKLATACEKFGRIKKENKTDDSSTPDAGSEEKGESVDGEVVPPVRGKRKNRKAVVEKEGA